MNLEKLLSKIPAIDTFDWKNGELIAIKKKPHAFIRDGLLIVSAEEGDGFVDYYGEHNNDTMFIHPTLDEWAQKNNGYWEWENPGAISFCKL